MISTLTPEPVGAMTDYSRKPIAPGIQPYSRYVPDSSAAASQQQRFNTHSRTRTTSSSIFPMNPVLANTQATAQQPYFNVNGNRRQPSNATTSTMSTGKPPSRANSNNSANIRRSTSSRSGSSPTSYVALMRKQKATVWCDRSQHEDPRMLAQAKAAKARATLEVTGGGTAAASVRTNTISSGGMVGKIRHHGAPKAVGYTGGNMAGGGVPMRLSASEVGDEDYDDENDSLRENHHRTGSGRSSLGSNTRFPSGYQRPPARTSTGNTPPSGNGSPSDIPEVSETPTNDVGSRDYFGEPSPPAPTEGGEDSFGSVGAMRAPSAAAHRESLHQSADELRRRGSVDDRTRTMTMSGVRLFVANPDLDD